MSDDPSYPGHGNELWRVSDGTELAEPYLADWFQRVYHGSGQLEPLKCFADRIVDNWDRVLYWFDTRISNGILEAINGLVQASQVARPWLPEPTATISP